MAQYNWVTGDLITAARLNANGYGLWKGVAGQEDTVVLADNVAATFLMKPTSDPAVTTQLFQVQNASSAVKFAIAADGSLYINPAGTTSKVPVKLDETTLSGSQASITLTPSGTYKHLRITGYAKSDLGIPDVLKVVFNADATAIYYSFYTSVTNGGTFATVSSVNGAAFMGLGYLGSAGDTTANSFSSFTFDIPHYANTTGNKIINGNYAHQYDVMTATSLKNGQASGFWTSTAAITSIVLSAGGNLVAGTTFDLYGIP